MRNKTVVTLVAVGVIGAGSYLINRSFDSGSQEIRQELSERTAPAASAPPLSLGGASRESLAQDIEGSVNPKKIEVAANSEYVKVWKEFEFNSELEKYTYVSQKALLSDEDREVKNQLLADARFINSLEKILTVPAVDDLTRKMQDSALDFVIEALSGNNKSAATAVLKSMVKDNQIEDSKLNSATRQALAGLKAEALYHWSAVDNSVYNEVPELLPGTVSKNIWENVKKQQSNNHAESQSIANHN